MLSRVELGVQFSFSACRTRALDTIPHTLALDFLKTSAASVKYCFSEVPMTEGKHHMQEYRRLNMETTTYVWVKVKVDKGAPFYI